MCSGQAAELTWDVDAEKTELHIPGERIRNKEDFSLPLVDSKGKTIKYFEFRNQHRRPGERIFAVTDFRDKWRQACDALKLGVFDKETRSYAGMSSRLPTHGAPKHGCCGNSRDGGDGDIRPQDEFHLQTLRHHRQAHG